MAGHNKWTQIKRKKGASDAQKSAMFSKLVRSIKTEARMAKGDANAPGLKAAVEKARAANMPKENIERAVATAASGAAEEKVIFETYGPGGAALIIEGLTDSVNRASQEVRHILSKQGFSLAAPGSAAWAFAKSAEGWEANTTVPLSQEDSQRLAALIEELENHNDIQEVFTNAQQV